MLFLMHSRSFAAKTASVHTLNRVMQLNLIFLGLHCLLYGGMPQMLLGLHNPFADLVIALAFGAIVGLWLCLDYMLPVYLEAKVNREKPISKPTGWLLSLNLLALAGCGVYWLPAATATLI